MSGMIVPKPIRNREIMFRALEGQSAEHIAEMCELSPETVKNILGSPLVKQEMEVWQERRKQEITEQVQEKAYEALEVVTDVMRGDIGSELRLKAAKEILDRDPRLQKKQSESGEFATGLGESIIREIAKKLVKAGQSHDVLRKMETVDDSDGSRGEGNSVVYGLPEPTPDKAA